ncbi:ribosome biogenesis protein tsr1 [Didymosphaeria variabile]|uniref:Ribosome biogenesis protein tsr1 n=1 Tax=Didymosphaeria variabile TaxID=1932322 RepID=A0A9W8XS47_9PLEO|nr:ribosome biogenesis protein tsr1 [Didymosphaeria variabile]KAJ4356225.1 ribosome biogenesis protein tsr1 [Didymosphaeria variabile]
MLRRGALKELSKGKVESLEKGSRRTPHQQVVSKFDRRNRAKQMRINKDHEHAKVTNVFNGQDGAPRIVAVIPLCSDVSAAAAVQSLNASLDINEEVPDAGWTRVNVDRFKQKVQYLVVQRDLLASLDACRIADFVVFILSGQEEVDKEGEIILKAIESQGISNTFTVVQALDKIEPAKRRPQVVASLKSYITHWLPTTERVFSLDNRQESSNLVRSLCTTTTKGVKWRDQRSYMFVEDVAWPGGKSAASEDGTGEVVLTGVVRGQGLKADRLLQIGDWGDFQIDKVVAAPLENRKKAKDDAMAVDSDDGEDVLDRAGEDRDDLADLAPEETIMDDVTNYAPSVAATERKGVLLDDHHYFSDEEEEDAPKRPRRLPKGTSNYQAAWYLDDCSDSGSDLEDFDMEDVDETSGGAHAHPADGIEGMDVDGRAMTEAGPSEYPQSEMFLDPAPEDEAAQIEAYRKSRKNEAEEDLEFPDEIELHPNVDARERLIRYRGLKSLRESVWEKDEDKPYEPSEWPRLLEISDYKRTATKFMREAWAGGVKPGTRVNVHLRGVPLSWQGSRPMALFSLLRHEHKRTACNYSMLLSSEYEGPIKSKTEIIAQCGPRRMIINPLFSQAGNTPNDVHKFDRYLHPGRSAIACFVGPITWGNVPVLYFQRTSSPASDFDSNVQPASIPTPNPSLRLIATGTSLPPSLNRVIAKRIILTGHPYKINKRIVTVRYMLFNDKDVKWFKSLPLWTRRGRSGFIKESLGTHGYFKATFDGKINPMDAVAVSLYKRMWPKTAKMWQP